nr:2OG-Fe(II) oxygenase [Bacteroidota bacterium]
MINNKYFDSDTIADLHNKFMAATPCKYVILENFLETDTAQKLYEGFPPLEDLNVKRKSMNENKKEEYHLERFDPVFQQLQRAMNEQRTYYMISKITGIEGLSSTDDALGSGVHQGGPGSFVDIHVDINMNPMKNLHRRINLLIYLNRYWKDEYGGGLELWDKGVKNMGACVLPNFNRAVIMETTDESYHGYGRINIPDHESRKSFYCYFYTPITGDFTFRDSRFKTRPDESNSKAFLTEAKETVKIGVKRFLKNLGIKSLDFQDKKKK